MDTTETYYVNTGEDDTTFDIIKMHAAANNLAVRMLENKEAYNVKGEPTLEELTNLILHYEMEHLNVNLISDGLIQFNDEIESIECLDTDVEMIDIKVTGTSLFYANNILTKNSSGPIMTCDFAMGIIRTPELDELNQQIIKQLASRYGDTSYYKRFLVGVDRSRMKLFNLEETAQSSLAKDIDEPKVSETNKFKKFNGASKKVNTQEWEF